MNIPGAWIDFLRAAGHTAVHWRQIGDIRAEDHEIMSWARENGHVVRVRPPRDVLAVVVVVVIESANEDDYDNDYDNDNERPSCNSQYHIGFTSFRSRTLSS